MPAWNAEATILRSIASAAQQDGVEVVVADDSSRDGTVAAVRADGRARVLTTSVNGGPAAARNRAIDAATGDWIAVLDADDTLRPGALAHLRAVAGETGADVVLCNLQRVDPAGRPIEARAYIDRPADAPPEPVTLSGFLAANHGRAGTRTLGYLKPLFRRAFLEARGLRYDETLRNGEDAHLVMECLAAGGRVVVSPRADYLYTVREGSLSHRADPDHLRALVAAGDRFAARHADALSPESRSLLAARRRALVEMAESEAILQAIKHRRPGAAASGLWNHPNALRRVLRQLAEAAGNRLDALRREEAAPVRRSGR
ncbi:glycosyltransferase family 2 protein [Jannaschia sp. W003]|uniref:glycosyltransferase family 2 protein n=1 Tax=Jannaschia sp. W003 TaxID=2867012 RepID=UPI0021A64BD7|nr:glycosyltransferase family 2 protein [Jannaschia sp. W003]UWQ21587.1 glycosyltransferase [Jannaschia sp. W003]